MNVSVLPPDLVAQPPAGPHAPTFQSEAIGCFFHIVATDSLCVPKDVLAIAPEEIPRWQPETMPQPSTPDAIGFAVTLFHRRDVSSSYRRLTSVFVS
jgi:hypothetical protein